MKEEIIVKETPSTNVKWRLLDKNGKQIGNNKADVCFATLMRSRIPDNVHTVVVFSDEKHTAYEKKYCRKWIKLIASFGFDVSYKYDIKRKEHQVIIPFNKESSNFKRTYSSSLFMFVRCLTEAGEISKLPLKYWELQEELKIKSIDDKFQLLQFTHQYIKANSNHQIRSNNAMKCFTLSQWKEKANSIKKTIKDSTGIDVSGLWTSKYIQKNKDFQAARSTNKMEKMNVYVVGGDNEYANWIPRKVNIVKDMKEAELVIFTGGEDVNPELYGEPMGKNTYCNFQRDEFEVKEYKKALKLELPMMGICRGSQFLCVMNGGKLVQDQSQSGPVHPIHTSGYGTIKISSSHHQAQFPYNLNFWDYKIIGWSLGESKYHKDGKGKELNPVKECEIVYYPNTKCLGIQGHPEYGYYKKGCPEDLKVVQQIFNDFMEGKLK